MGVATGGWGVGERRGEKRGRGVARESGAGESEEGRVGRREGEGRRVKKEVRDRMGKSGKVGIRIREGERRKEGREK